MSANIVTAHIGPETKERGAVVLEEEVTRAARLLAIATYDIAADSRWTTQGSVGVEAARWVVFVAAVRAGLEARLAEMSERERQLSREIEESLSALRRRS